ncbi:hypothetical protein NHX12_029004 [Muraenolepis orangiensis]|uniref:Coiled-coil domain-containing protein 125 n=1 Tax=Muraenolepis orangiensis TaxID=630683 RepID=A0A9Q0EEU2_9TELE|nr:hypothetical protein NHX12_029004 [Muraenolepis orangiensis]
MQGTGGEAAWSPVEDNMAEGDLGDGLDQRGPRRTESGAGEAGFSSLVSQYVNEKDRGVTAIFDIHMFDVLQGSLVDLSKEELRERLQESTETLEMLRCELEVTHRYLEGKYQALKILQGKTILDKATTHTKDLLQKNEDRAKEVNALRWEVAFNQVQLKKFEQSWEQKFNRMNTENASLSESLRERLKETRELRAENTVLGQRSMELLSMLSIKEQKEYQGTKPPLRSHLETAVLRACRCPGVMEFCHCAETAAASRSQLLQLRQELDLLLRSREEALLVADAFRIAFEQQLRKRSEHLLLLAKASKSYPSRTQGKSYPSRTQGKSYPSRTQGKSYPSRTQGKSYPSRTQGKSYPSRTQEAKESLEHNDTLHRLLDLLNDTEEALAHQRKVSHMLAHHAEQLQQRLPVEAAWPVDSPSKPCKTFNSTFLSSLQLTQSDLENKQNQLHQSKISPRGTPDTQNQKQESSEIKTQKNLQKPGPRQKNHQTQRPRQKNHQTQRPRQKNLQKPGPRQKNHQTQRPRQKNHQTQRPRQKNLQKPGPRQKNHQTPGPIKKNHQTQ